MFALHDSFSKKKSGFKPFKKKTVAMYNCGPTVYDYVHIGNLRYFVFTDLLRRWLEQKGYEVRQVMNITDVGHMLSDADAGEDKMDVAARESGRSPAEIAAFYTEAFFADIDRLGIKRAEFYPRASEHVPEMIALIERLLAKGMAYRADGNVYFDVAAFPGYGRLSGNTLENLEAGARIEVREEKKHPADFALWIRNPKHLMQWNASWGRGYPGWHVECSAMAMKYLGETIDIHTGGEDNKFPHHECELAQSEGATGAQFSRFWLHVTHLLVDGEKMSKSKKNFFTLNDLTRRGYEPREVRYLLLATHYRQPLNFTFAGLDAARGALSRLDNFVDALAAAKPERSGRAGTLAKKTLAAAARALDDDLNVAEALAVVFDFVRAMNEKTARGALTERDRIEAIEFMNRLGAIFGFNFGRPEAASPPSVMILVEKRDLARRERRFAEADRLRDEIAASGFMVEDTPEGRRIKKI